MAPIQAQRVLMTRSPARQILYPSVVSASNMFTSFSERGVTPVRWETVRSSSSPVSERSSRSRNSHLVRSVSQCAGISPSQGMPESRRGARGSRPRVTARVMSARRFSAAAPARAPSPPPAHPAAPSPGPGSQRWRTAWREAERRRESCGCQNDQYRARLTSPH